MARTPAATGPSRLPDPPVIACISNIGFLGFFVLISRTLAAVPGLLRLRVGEPLPNERCDPVVGGARAVAGFLPERLWWDLQGKCIHDGGGLIDG
jgi:hypothetical protein